MTSDDTRARILNAAGPIFAEKGYEAATVREICHEAGVNVASVNYYFGGKERLYIEAVSRAHPARSGPRFEPSWPSGTPPEKKLTDFVAFLLAHLLGLKSASWEERLFVREVMNPTPACRDILRDHFRIGFDQLQRILDEILPPDTPACQRHQIGFSIIGQCVYYRASRNIVPLLVGQPEVEEHYGVEQLAEHISGFCLAALGLGPPLGDPRRSRGREKLSPRGRPEGSGISADQNGKELNERNVS